MLQQKYQSVLDLGQELNIQNGDVREEEGKLFISGTAQTPYEKDVLWNEIKRVGGDAPTDVEAEIEVTDNSRYHTHTVVKGDTLGHIAKHYYGSAGKYPKIFDANRDILDDPNKIRRGQELVIPIIEL
ncbi:MAG: LysM peptidoglycan-binding domain-containing protein [Aureispira sp.]